MDLKDLLTIDKGVTFILSCLVIYFLYLLIKNLPKWIETFAKILQDNAISTDNNTKVMREVKTVIGNTEGMHRAMDARIAKIESTIEELKQMLTEALENNKPCTSPSLMLKVNQLEKEVSALKKTKESEN